MAESPRRSDDDDLDLLSALRAGLEDCQERLDDPDISLDEAFALMHQRNALDEDLALVQGRITARGIQTEMAMDEQERDEQEVSEEEVEEEFEEVIEEDSEQVADPLIDHITDEGDENEQIRGAATEQDLDQDSDEAIKDHDVERPARAGPVDASTQAEDEETRQCRACLEDLGAHALKECPCGDEYCEDCLERIFVTALTDETKFPPRCCQQRIQLNQEWNFVNDNLIHDFAVKAEELSTPNRLYCAEPGCGHWIHPKNIHNGHGLCFATSLSDAESVRQRRQRVCAASTCVLCKNLRHDGSGCPQDQELHELAATEGWQKCNSCNGLIELDTGCYHISKSTVLRQAAIATYKEADAMLIIILPA